MFLYLIRILQALSRHGRIALVAGLLGGLLLPGMAANLRPWLPQLVMALLFLVALRIGPRRAMEGLKNTRTTLITVVVFQLILPIAAICLALLFGIANTAYAMAIVLVLAAPALSGSPNLAAILGADPEPAFRLLIVGTALLPLTIIPVFWLLPQFGDLQIAVMSAAKTLMVISAAMGAGFWVRYRFWNDPDRQQTDTMDGAMTVALVVIVIALMSAVRPTLQQTPGVFAFWMCLAFGVNFGLQAISFAVLRNTGKSIETVPFSVVAGNRNLAIFLVAMSPAAAEPLLIFLGCYQFPMYLTPILMDPLYRRHNQTAV